MLLTLKLAEAAKPLILFPLLLQIQQLPVTHPVATCKQNHQKQPILQPKAQPTLQSTASFPCTAQPSPGLLRAALNFFSLLQKAPGATAARESVRVPGVSYLPPSMICPSRGAEGTSPLSQAGPYPKGLDGLMCHHWLILQTLFVLLLLPHVSHNRSDGES